MLVALAAHTALALHSAAVAARLVEAHETERRRIERNIHDGAQQQLAALMLRLGIARQQLGGSGAEATLVALQGELRAIMEDLRALAQGIHPSVLTDGGLAEAVAQRCDQLPVPVSLEVDAWLGEHRLADETEGAGYFLVSEALANVLKHAGASAVEVRLRRDDGHIAVEVVDDGVGFDPAGVAGRGLGALADRLAALGGTLVVDSARGSGTRVSGRLPLREREGAAHA
jgi:signal transduction histidine kinase